MIKTSLIAGSIALSAMASAAAAQGFSGNIGLSYAQPSESEQLSVTEYFGGLEYSINRNFAVALDIHGFSVEDIDSTLASSTWHFIYHMNEDTSFALFAGSDIEASEENDGLAAQGVTFAGLEAGTELGEAEAEAYIGFSTTDDAQEDFTIFGASGEYGFASGFSAIGSAEFISSDVLDQSNLAIGVEYEVNGGPEIYGKIGRQALEAGDQDVDTTYFEIGASVSFGNQRGTTFNGRSLFNQF